MSSRRQFIGMGTVVAGVALAGCGDIIGDDDDPEQSYGRMGELVPEIDDRPVSVVGQGVSELADVSDFADISPDDPLFGTEASDIEYSVSVTIGDGLFAADQVGIVIGSIEFDEIRSDIEGEFDTVQEIEEVEGFRTLEAGSDEQAVYYGTDGETVVFATDRERYDATIMAVTANETLLFESSDELGSLSSVLDDENLVLFELEPESMAVDPTGDAVAGGVSIAVSEDESEYTAAVMFDSDSEASDNESSVRDAVAESQPGLESVETDVDGRIITARGTITTAEIQ